MKGAHGLGGDERRLLGGLGDDGIAGRERGGDLARENRERKVPGTDADDEAERGRASEHRCAPPRARSSAGSRPPRALPDRVGVGLAGLAYDQADERDALLRGCRRRGAEARRAPSGGLGPAPRPAVAAREGGSDFGRERCGMADDVAMVGGVHDRRSPGVLFARGRQGAPGRQALAQSIGERGEALFVGEIEAARIDPIGP